MQDEMPMLLSSALQSQASRGDRIVLSIVSRIILAALALLVAQPALAEWHEASSDHFVIYADDKEADIRRFAENLERYHAAMAYVLSLKSEKPSPSNRVTIYVVGDQSDIRKLAGTESRFVAGFYIPRAGGSRAFVQDIRNQRGYPHFSTIVLLHEYAHHFLMTATPYAMPRWMNEGAAEFFAAAGFEDDGSVLVGRPAQHRGRELVLADPVHVRELLDAEGYDKQRKSGYDAFYGKSWLLYHYLIFSQERSGQLTQYQRNLFNGMGSLAAGEAAFGDLDTLERELKSYIRNRRWLNIGLTPDKVPIGAITMRRLTQGEAAMMPLQIRSQRGVNREKAAELLPDVRAVAARFPEDAGVLTALAEAEYDAGNDAEAISAADRAVARDPSRVNAYVQKGFAMFRQARAAEDKAAAFEAAMKPFEALNAMENDHPLPLAYYYRSFAERRVKPPEDARAALERASVLAPFDLQLQLNTATMLIREGKFALASDFLAPLSVNPHGGKITEMARRLREKLASAPTDVTIDAQSLADEAEAEEDVEETPATPAPTD
jgi:tetratricopeptide (TPR) repeat protein